MKIALLALALVAAAPFAVPVSAAGGSTAAQRPTDAQIRKLMIEESIAAYPGNCPCPYNLARNGSRCGRRSAYDREGGANPLCYPKDVTDAMVQEYRDAHRGD